MTIPLGSSILLPEPPVVTTVLLENPQPCSPLLEQVETGSCSSLPQQDEHDSPTLPTKRRGRRSGHEQKRSLSACLGCRRHKIRCAGGNPCDACRKYKRQCEFVGRNMKASKSLLRMLQEEREKLQKKLQALEQKIGSLQN
jgi:Fungal Zn(2)-Cys(6) binuclear cluster domain